MMVVLSFGFAIVGFALLALSLAKHYRDLFGRILAVQRSRAFRIAGWLLLGASMIGAIAAQGVAFGIILWAALLNVAALIVGLSITYRETWWRT